MRVGPMPRGKLLSGDGDGKESFMVDMMGGCLYRTLTSAQPHFRFTGMLIGDCTGRRKAEAKIRHCRQVFSHVRCMLAT